MELFLRRLRGVLLTSRKMEILLDKKILNQGIAFLKFP
jgi:hypothetical protein